MKRQRGNNPDKNRWSNADQGEVHRSVFRYVEQVEHQQFALFNRFVQLEHLYDPNCPTTPGQYVDDADGIGLVIENVIASNVDTVTAAIAATEIRARFLTDDGDWTMQRTATMLEWYAEGMGKLLDLSRKLELMFKSAAMKGTGILKIYSDSYDEIRVDNVRVDDIIVDEAECRSGGTPRQLHHRMINVDREELKARFPEYELEIDRAQRGPVWSSYRWAGYRPIDDDALVAIESWKLPVGRLDSKGYRTGRHTITIDGCDLLDEDWDDHFFPFECMLWSERSSGWYGISLAERIAGIQRALNKRNWQIDRNLDQYAVPVTYVDMADANLAIRSINRIGTVVVTKGQRPSTVMPQANSAEVYANRETLKGSAFEESGVSRLAASAAKPGGIDSGVGLREYRDQTTQRFAPQEKRLERAALGVMWHVLERCKALGDRAPVIARKAKFGSRKIKWGDVDMGDVRVQISAASTLPRTPAGRYQTALEWAQAGVISTDEWRRLTKHPDLDHILSLYTQGMESVERDIESIVYDNEVVVPEPFGNIQLMVRQGQMAYLKYRDLGAPEEVLEGLRQYVVLAAHILSQSSAAAPGQAPADSAQQNAQPVAALSPQAMALRSA